MNSQKVLTKFWLIKNLKNKSWQKKHRTQVPQHLENGFNLYSCCTNVNVNKESGVAKSAPSLPPEIRTPIVEKKLLVCQEKTPMISRSPLLGPKTPAAKDRTFAGHEKSKHNPME